MHWVRRNLTSHTMLLVIRTLEKLHKSRMGWAKSALAAILHRIVCIIVRKMRRFTISYPRLYCQMKAFSQPLPKPQWKWLHTNTNDPCQTQNPNYMPPGRTKIYHESSQHVLIKEPTREQEEKVPNSLKGRACINRHTIEVGRKKPKSEAPK